MYIIFLHSRVVIEFGLHCALEYFAVLDTKVFQKDKMVEGDSRFLSAGVSVPGGSIWGPGEGAEWRGDMLALFHICWPPCADCAYGTNLRRQWHR